MNIQKTPARPTPEAGPQAKTSPLMIPVFEPELVADHLRDGYWLEAPDLNQDGKPDLFGYGLRLGEIYWYQNGDWTRRLITDGVRMPVGGDYADISGNGYPDPIICYDLYGDIGTIVDAKETGGKIDWIENPGPGVEEAKRWTRHYIGRATGMHRLRAGYFTQTERLEIIGFPIVTKGNVHGVLPLVMFTQPDDPLTAQEWPMTTIDDMSYRMLHGAEKKRGLIPGSDRDSVLVASDEGVTWIYYDADTATWQHVRIGEGETTQFEETGFKGSGDLDAGRIDGVPMSYVAAIEPFHGNTVAIYTRDPESDPATARWARQVLDVYGDPNENGEGPGHQILCADFDGDGDEEFLVGLRGPWPWQGVMYYKMVDKKAGVFAKWRVSDDSVARIAMADFNGDGRPDFATIAYSVDNYYRAKQARLMVFRNRIGDDEPSW